MKRFFWSLFPVFVILISINNIFYDWELQNFGFNELEDFGRLLFVLTVSVLESTIVVVFLWWVWGFIKNKNRN